MQRSPVRCLAIPTPSDMHATSALDRCFLLCHGKTLWHGNTQEHSQGKVNGCSAVTIMHICAGVCLNLLRSKHDGQKPGVPVHILLRHFLNQTSVAQVQQKPAVQL